MLKVFSYQNTAVWFAKKWIFQGRNWCCFSVCRLSPMWLGGRWKWRPSLKRICNKHPVSPDLRHRQNWRLYAKINESIIIGRIVWLDLYTNMKMCKKKISGETFVVIMGIQLIMHLHFQCIIVIIIIITTTTNAVRFDCFIYIAIAISILRDYVSACMLVLHCLSVR